MLGGIYDEKRDMFIGVCNVGTGFTDEQLKNIYKMLSKDISSKRPKNVEIEKGLDPDVWVDPKVVFTVEADEVTKKKDSRYPSLRFPRLIEWDRDKGITEVSTIKELEGMLG